MYRGVTGSLSLIHSSVLILTQILQYALLLTIIINKQSPKGSNRSAEKLNSFFRGHLGILRFVTGITFFTQNPELPKI